MNKNILTLFVLDDNEKKELLEKYLLPHDKTVSEVKKNNIINLEPEIPPEDKAENIPDIDILPDKKVSAKEKDTVKKTNGKKFAVIASVFAAVIVAFTSFCISQKVYYDMKKKDGEIMWIFLLALNSIIQKEWIFLI